MLIVKITKLISFVWHETSYKNGTYTIFKLYMRFKNILGSRKTHYSSSSGSNVFVVPSILIVSQIIIKLTCQKMIWYKATWCKKNESQFGTWPYKIKIDYFGLNCRDYTTHFMVQFYGNKLTEDECVLCGKSIFKANKQ